MTSWARCTSKVGATEVRCGRVAGHPAEHRLPASARKAVDRKYRGGDKPTLADQKAKAAYLAGWNASKTSKTYDLGEAETRYERKHGDPFNMFSAGWSDYASDYPKFDSFDREGHRR